MHRKEFGDQALSGLAWKLTALHRPLAGFMEWRGREREQCYKYSYLLTYLLLQTECARWCYYCEVLCDFMSVCV